MVVENTSPAIQGLRDAIRGHVIGPGDAEYDGARAVFVGGIDRRPTAIARAADAADVARVVSLARDMGLPLAVRSGGHSGAGHSVCDGGIVLDLKEMCALDIDVAGRTAWAETGLTAGAYTTAAVAHGLATGFGDTGSVGIGGLTVGGGVGYLVRKHGLTIDDLLAADVVTADGELRHVDANTHPDLFWAIRGGGGNFGVATRFKFRLHPVDSFVGGMLMLPATAEIIGSFVALAEAAPDELSTIGNVMPAPPMPFVPAEHHGKLVIFAMLAHAGDLEAGQRAIAPFRSLATPIVDLVKPQPYSGMYPPDDPSYHPVAANHTLFVDEVDARSAGTIMDFLERSAAPMRVAQIRVLGGAMSRVPVDATAFAHRNRRIMVTVAALYQRPEDAATHKTWATAFAAALQRGPVGAYVNFVGDEGEARIHDIYPAPTLDRLAAIKRRYDPTNLFRLNQNVPPAAEQVARA
jgi:FAD/FMN-containing dehydrogenase